MVLWRERCVVEDEVLLLDMRNRNKEQSRVTGVGKGGGKNMVVVGVCDVSEVKGSIGQEKEGETRPAVNKFGGIWKEGQTIA